MDGGSGACELSDCKMNPAGTAWTSDLSKLGLKDASVQQPLFMNRCPFLVIPSEAEGSAVPRTPPGNLG
jgi:hypothetical protein